MKDSVIRMQKARGSSYEMRYGEANSCQIMENFVGCIKIFGFCLAFLHLAFLLPIQLAVKSFSGVNLYLNIKH